MQPQNPQTGYNQQNVGGQGLPQVPQTPLLQHSGNEMSMQNAPQSSLEVPAGGGDDFPTEYWLKQVQEALQADAQSPNKRATKVADIKARYQQQVLGVKGRTKAE